MIKIYKKNLSKRIIFVIAIIILGVLCVTAYNRFNPVERLLTGEEINEFIQKKDIYPIIIQQVGNSFTAIVYDEQEYNEKILYCLFKNRKGQLQIQKYSFISHWEEEEQKDKKIYISGTSAPSMDIEPYLSIIINDKETAQKAYKATVLYDNGKEETVLFENNTIVIVPATRKFFWEKPLFKVITVFGKDGDIIYKVAISPDLL